MRRLVASGPPPTRYRCVVEQTPNAVRREYVVGDFFGCFVDRVEPAPHERFVLLRGRPASVLRRCRCEHVSTVVSIGRVRDHLPNPSPTCIWRVLRWRAPGRGISLSAATRLVGADISDHQALGNVAVSHGVCDWTKDHRPVRRQLIERSRSTGRTGVHEVSRSTDPIGANCWTTRNAMPTPKCAAPLANQTDRAQEARAHGQNCPRVSARSDVA
jgi:hypothetical protein